MRLFTRLLRFASDVRSSSRLSARPRRATTPRSLNSTRFLCTLPRKLRPAPSSTAGNPWKCARHTLFLGCVVAFVVVLLQLLTKNLSAPCLFSCPARYTSTGLCTTRTPVGRGPVVPVQGARHPHCYGLEPSPALTDQAPRRAPRS